MPVTKSRLATVLTSDVKTAVPLVAYRSVLVEVVYSFAWYAYLVGVDDPWNITKMVCIVLTI